MNPRFGSYNTEGYSRLYVTLPQGTRKKLERMAAEEHRSLSNMITHLIEIYNEKEYKN